MGVNAFSREICLSSEFTAGVKIVSFPGLLVGQHCFFSLELGFGNAASAFNVIIETLVSSF